MTAWPRLLLIPITLGSLLVGFDPSRPLGVREASAQLSPNQLPQPGVPTPADKPEGVAEQAKDGPDQLPTTPVIPQTRNKRKRFELFELDGYYRFRTDWFKNFHLGFNDYAGYGVPFPQPLGCQLVDTTGDQVTVLGPCEDSVKGANMRLRLEPTININETTRVYLQIDVLDNLVLGATPADATQLGAFAGNQVPPEVDRDYLDYLGDSVRVRRAWAEVDTSLGQVSFGRQPWHWGLGIYANAGGADPFSGTYDLDSDYGDTVDRVMFRATIPGTNLEAAIATDWALTAPSAAQDALVADSAGGQPWDLEDNDDVSQWVFMITRFDRPELFAENMDRGELALNYGGFLAYRTQDWASSAPGPDQTLADTLVRRGLKTYTPDVWARLGKGKLLVELEGVATIGSVDNVSDIELPRYPVDRNDPDALDPAITESLDIRRFGAVVRANYKAAQDKLDLGFELGYASGDQWDRLAPGATHLRHARPLAAGGNDTTLEDFRFDFDYEVDLILFREIIGAVSNATYLKPSGSYLITDQIRGKAQAIVSFANRPVATPGNSALYGLEFDGDVSYRSGAFTAGIAGGILVPFGALDRPASDSGLGGSGYGFGPTSQGASTAYTVQTRLSLQF